MWLPRQYLCVLSEVADARSHTRTHLRVAAGFIPLPSVPEGACEVWWLMGNFVHAWVHKDSHSVACMLDLSQFSTLLCARVTPHWPGASPEVSSSIGCLCLISSRIEYPSNRHWNLPNWSTVLPPFLLFCWDLIAIFRDYVWTDKTLQPISWIVRLVQRSVVYNSQTFPVFHLNLLCKTPVPNPVLRDYVNARMVYTVHNLTAPGGPLTLQEVPVVWIPQSSCCRSPSLIPVSLSCFPAHISV